MKNKQANQALFQLCTQLAKEGWDHTMLLDAQIGIPINPDALVLFVSLNVNTDLIPKTFNGFHVYIQRESFTQNFHNLNVTD